MELAGVGPAGGKRAANQSGTLGTIDVAQLFRTHPPSADRLEDLRPVAKQLKPAAEDAICAKAASFFATIGWSK